MTKQQLVSLMTGLDTGGIIADYLDDYETTEGALEAWYDDLTTNYVDEDQQKIIALMEVADLDWSEAEQAIDDCDYYVYTDEQADEAFDLALEDYLDECILPELPESAQRYFDREAWKSDASCDGRGHTLAAYDGDELYTTILDTEYYIYRCN